MQVCGLSGARSRRSWLGAPILVGGNRVRAFRVRGARPQPGREQAAPVIGSHACRSCRWPRDGHGLLRGQPGAKRRGASGLWPTGTVTFPPHDPPPVVGWPSRFGTAVVSRCGTPRSAAAAGGGWRLGGIAGCKFVPTSPGPLVTSPKLLAEHADLADGTLRRCATARHHGRLDIGPCRRDLPRRHRRPSTPRVNPAPCPGAGTWVASRFETLPPGRAGTRAIGVQQ
jgi:hypothetical protein